VFAASGEAWRSQRNMVMAAFGPQTSEGVFPVTRTSHRAPLSALVQSHASNGTAFDLQADLMRFTVDAVAGLAFGMDSIRSSQSRNIQTHLNYIFPMLNRSVSPRRYLLAIGSNFPPIEYSIRHLLEVHRRLPN